MSKSLCTCHNETVNIWTHLFGSIVFLGIFIILPAIIVPKRFEVGHAMAQTLQETSVSPVDYIDTQLYNAEASMHELSEMALTSDQSVYQQRLFNSYGQVEGLTYLAFHNLAHFYISQTQTESGEDLSVQEAIQKWADNTFDTCERLTTLLAELQTIMIEKSFMQVPAQSELAKVSQQLWWFSDLGCSWNSTGED